MDRGDRPLGLLARRVETEHVQQVQHGRRRGPLREVRSTTPTAVGVLCGQEPSPPALAGDARALGVHLFGRGIGEVPKHLPADRRIGIEQPVDDIHAFMVPRLGDTVWQESVIPDAEGHDPTRN
jgi:hypothetical protein